MGGFPHARAALWSACGPRGLLRLLYALDRGAGAGSDSGGAALQRNFLFFVLAGGAGRPSLPTPFGVGRCDGAPLPRAPGRLALSLKSVWIGWQGGNAAHVPEKLFQESFVIQVTIFPEQQRSVERAGANCQVCFTGFAGCDFREVQLWLAA